MIGLSWQETFLELHEAQTTGELWSVLLAPHGIRSSSGWDEPYLLFRRFHDDDPTDAPTTALLLCTDHRWRKAAHRLIHELASSELLDDPALDQLAVWFVAVDLTVSVQVPTGPGRGDADLVRVTRSAWPPLRRWAAARHLRSATVGWRDLLDIAAELPRRDAAMLLAGVMDAIEALSETDRAAVTEVGLASGSGVVRLAALPALAALAGPGVARAHAASDPSEKVRAWATKAPQTTVTSGQPPDPGAGHQAPKAEQPPPRDEDVPTLF